MLQIISKLYQRADQSIDQEVLQALIFSLLQQTELPSQTIDNYLSSQDARIVALAARLLARQQHADTHSLALLAQALAHFLQQWQLWQQSSPQQRPRFSQQAINSDIAIRALLWATIRHHSHVSHIQHLLTVQHPEYFVYQQIILEALLAYPAKDFSNWQNVINDYQQHSNPVLAQLAQQIQAQHQQKNVDQQYSSLIPQLIAQANSQQLIALANNHKLEESTRFSAIEGLARLQGNTVANSLEQLSKDQDEDIRKAAFKALRRYQRLQQKQVGTQASGASR